MKDVVPQWQNEYYWLSGYHGKIFLWNTYHRNLHEVIMVCCCWD